MNSKDKMMIFAPILIFIGVSGTASILFFKHKEYQEAKLMMLMGISALLAMIVVEFWDFNRSRNK